MFTSLRSTVTIFLVLTTSVHAQDAEPSVTLEHRGLHGYIGSHAGSTPDDYRYGAGFYASVWSLIERPIRRLPDRPALHLADSRQFRQHHRTTVSRGHHRSGPLARAWPDLRQRLPNRRRWTGLLGGQPIPLRATKVQHERHAQLLQHRSGLAWMAILSQ